MSLAERVDKVFARRRGLVVIYVFFLAAYLLASGPRLKGHSPHNHFVYLADGWLHGRLALDGPPPNENDWARVEVLELKDGRTVRGKFSSVGRTDRFLRSTGGSETIPADAIARRKAVRYVSFPPFPAVLMLPFVAFMGLGFNDVLFNVAWAALNPVLLFLLLRDLVRRKHSQRRVSEDLLLVIMMGLGTVYFTAAATAQVWYTAHVVAVTLSIGYVWAALDASRPWLAGVMLGLGFATRPPLGYTVLLFLCEAVRVSGGWRELGNALWRQRRLPSGLFTRLVACAVPAAAILALLLVFNYARFDRFLVFGHEYLNIRWKERGEHWGLFNYHFLSRNLACALVLLPKILARYPYVQYSHHGLSMFVTSPNLAWLFSPRRRTGEVSRALWLTVLVTALPTLLYYLSGYQQFGYRYLNDYVVLLVVLLAIGGQPLGRLWKVMLVLAIGINLFGAITFDRYREFSYEDRCIFPHGCN